MTRKEELEKEIAKLKVDLADYVRLYPLLNVTEAESERVINQYLDDILVRRKELEIMI
ncbi:hypothetical protein FACS189411_12820 [Bacteroidia bacterium]|nr:hypothetical protein FACS189411_12820 [Bacteroidia bacterium]